MAFILLPVKVSFADTLRHRPTRMSPFRFRNEPPYIFAEEEEEESSSRNALFIAIGAAAGFAAGVLMAERFGGFKGLTDRIKDTFGGGTEGEQDFDYEGLDEDEFDPDFDEDLDTPKGSLNGSEELEDRSLKEDRAFMAAADDIPDTAERRKSTKKARGGRTDGSAVAPSGVPKADHVSDPEQAPPTTSGRARPNNA